MKTTLDEYDADDVAEDIAEDTKITGISMPVFSGPDTPSYQLICGGVYSSSWDSTTGYVIFVDNL